jgi:hypothetical protein
MIDADLEAAAVGDTVGFVDTKEAAIDLVHNKTAVLSLASHSPDGNGVIEEIGGGAKRKSIHGRVGCAR